MTKTLAERVLHEIAFHSNGMTVPEIRQWILVQRGLIGVFDKIPRNKHGVWADHLLEDNPHGSHMGILLKYCTKLPSGRWILTEPIVGPFTTMKVETKSYIANQDRKQGVHERKVRSWPECPNCGSHRDPHLWSKVPDGKACWGMNGAVANYDCLGRVWKIMGPDVPPVLTTVTKEQLRSVEYAADLNRNMLGNYGKEREFVSNWLSRFLVKEG
jgi:hypothetical protein